MRYSRITREDGKVYVQFDSEGYRQWTSWRNRIMKELICKFSNDIISSDTEPKILAEIRDLIKELVMEGEMPERLSKELALGVEIIPERNYIDVKHNVLNPDYFARKTDAVDPVWAW